MLYSFCAFGWFMLNLQVAMKRGFVGLLILWCFIAWGKPVLQTVESAQILSPQSGEAVQGIVPITVNTDIAGVTRSEIFFGYMDDTSDTWFWLVESSQPIANGTIFNWDTTVIPDGNYRLRLRVFTTSGSYTDYAVESVRVRNYSIIETSTPVTDSTPADPVVTQTITMPAPVPTTVPATATVFPANPAIVTREDLVRNVKSGALYAMLTLLAVAIFLTARAASRRR